MQFGTKLGMCFSEPRSAWLDVGDIDLGFCPWQKIAIRRKLKSKKWFFYDFGVVHVTYSVTQLGLLTIVLGWSALW